LIAVTALALNVLATIYPALRASRIVPADELRYE
jgi:lipoprotein-releasing system permease protein